MKRNKKLILSSFIIPVAPLAVVVSCGTSPTTPRSYTVGIVSQAISSLNHIKYRNSVPIAHSIVESLFKTAPEHKSELENTIAANKIWFGYSESGSSAQVFNNISALSYESGTLRTNETVLNIPSSSRNDYGLIWEKGKTKLQTNNFLFNLNGKSEWENGQKLISSNFIDSIVYMLDVNTASQNLDSILSLDIKNAREFIDAQNEYAKVFGVTYKNPFGYKYHELPVNASDELKKVWNYYVQTNSNFELQRSKANEAKERPLVQKIQNAAKNLGIFGDKFSSHPDPNSSKLFVKEDANSIYTIPNVNGEFVQPYQLRIEFTNFGDSLSYLSSLLQSSSAWIPVNKKFIEDIGGIENYGKTKDDFLSEGPFKIKDVTFGLSGQILLTKNEDYHDSKRVIPKSVKVYFQDDPNVQISMYEDGYISQATLNAINLKKLYSNLTQRPLIQKVGGRGTTALTLNLDKETNKNSALLDPDFRRAMFFAIDRTSLISQSGFQATIPSYSFSVPEAPTLTSIFQPLAGINSLYASQGHSTNFGDGKDEIPLYPFSATDYNGISQLYSSYNKNDKVKNITRAKAFLNKYKARNPLVNRVKLTFAHNSTTMMVNMALELKSELQKAFGGFIDIELKGYPASIYESFISEGKFDITWRNLDKLGSTKNIFGGNQGFFYGDGIRRNDMKSNGFRFDPAGSWTLENMFDDLSKSKYGENEQQMRTRLGISTINWNKIKELSTLSNDPTLTYAEKITNRRQRVDAFAKIIPATIKNQAGVLIPNPDHDPNFDSGQEISRLAIDVNKIIMDQSPLLPTFVVDVTVKISRIQDNSMTLSDGGLNFDFIYDRVRPPIAGLPKLNI